MVMSEQVQELIDKIKRDGYAAADEKAKEIENNARERAEQILIEARKEAERLIEEARLEAEKSFESSRAALAQASRDTLIVLRQEIQGILRKIVEENVSAALTPELLTRLIESAVQGTFRDGKTQETLVHASSADVEKLQGGGLAGLQQKLKSGVTLRPSGDVGKGLIISFDKGKSSFDFSDQSLIAYLSPFLNAKLAEILKTASGNGDG
jgi:V/A-type H+/Na+-transporting ATPase subunit E